MNVLGIIEKVNMAEITGRELSVSEKQEIVDTLLKACRKAPENIAEGRLYPVYFVPDYAAKSRMFQGYLPKTKILAGNYYELEALRILAEYAPRDARVAKMVENTLARLKSTCFGNFCPLGECTAASICTLRFLNVTRPDDTEWIDRLAEPLIERFRGFRGRAACQCGVPVTYLLLALSETKSEKAGAALREKKDWISEYSGKTVGKYLSADQAILKSINI